MFLHILLITTLLFISTSLGQEILCFSDLRVTGAPQGVFTQTLPFIQAIQTQDCGNQYPECFAKRGLNALNDVEFTNENSVCREVLRYTVPKIEEGNIISSEANADLGVCGSPISADCQCQLPVLAARTNITITVNAVRDSCCQPCSCVGDPHCTSFDGTLDTWVVCGGRDPDTCDIVQSFCHAKVWGGKACQFVEDRIGGGACRPDPSVPQPMMNMYSKTYYEQTVEKTVQIDLQLGSLGNIVCVLATYGVIANGLEKIKICTPNAIGGPGPFLENRVATDTIVGKAFTNLLFEKTGVAATIYLRGLGGGSERFDITLDDQSNLNGNKGGFCQINEIVENPNPGEDSCTPGEGFLYQRLCWMNKLRRGTACGARQTSPEVIQEAKRWWCRESLSSSSLVPLRDQCIQQPWYKSVCLVLYPFSPDKYAECLDVITVVPNEIVIYLADYGRNNQNRRKSTLAPTPAPTECTQFSKHPFFVTGEGGNYVGGRPDPNSYVFIQKLVSSSNGVEIFSEPILWISIDQILCGQSFNIAEGTLDVLEGGATYRIIQCQTPSADCTSKWLNLDVKVEYEYPEFGNLNTYSEPFGKLFNEGYLTCDTSSNSPYKHCPDKYRCCIWTSKNQAMWNECMKFYHPNDRDSRCVPIDPL